MQQLIRFEKKKKGILKTNEVFGMAIAEVLRISMGLAALFSRSTLLPRTTNGNLSGSLGDACMRNSSLQLSRDLKVEGAVTSYTRTQQSAPR